MITVRFISDQTSTEGSHESNSRTSSGTIFYQMCRMILDVAGIHHVLYVAYIVFGLILAISCVAFLCIFIYIILITLYRLGPLFVALGIKVIFCMAVCSIIWKLCGSIYASLPAPIRPVSVFVLLFIIVYITREYFVVFVHVK